MKRFLSKLKENYASTQMLPVWLFGMLLIVQVVFNFLWVASPFNLVLSIVLIVFYLVLGKIFLDFVDSLNRLDLERNQINAFIRSISDSAISYNKHFEIILVNPAMEKLLGLPRQMLEGKVITPESVHDPRYELLTKIIFPSLAPKILSRSIDTYPQKTKVQFFQPRELILGIVTTKVIDESGKTYGFLKIIRDLSQEEALKKSQSDFITIAAHQLRTPLSGLSWSLEMLSGKEVGDLNEQQEKLVQEGKSAVKESLKTVEDLLRVAQIAEGNFGFQFSSVDIKGIIKEVFTKFKPAADKNNIKLIFYPPQFKLDPFTMDPLRIQLVIEILVDNAIKYNVSNGEVRIKLDLLKDKPFLAVSVEDTGQGIDSRDFSRLFTKFFRSDKVIKEQTSGIGLGLYVAKNIVQRHGGEIWAKSTLDR